MTRILSAAILSGFFYGCGSSDAPSAAIVDSETVDASPDATSSAGEVGPFTDASDATTPTGDTRLVCSSGTPTGKAAGCASKSDLGRAFSAGFGRADGIVRAVVPPTERHCEASCNGTHLSLEVAIHGKTQRLVITTYDTSTTDHQMRFAERDAALVGGAWAEGWHTTGGVQLDYPTTLGVHDADFAKADQNALAQKISDQIAVGDKVSVFAVAESDPTAAHLVHRNGKSNDGAIVVRPDSAPHYLLFYYDSKRGF